MFKISSGKKSDFSVAVPPKFIKRLIQKILNCLLETLLHEFVQKSFSDSFRNKKRFIQKTFLGYLQNFLHKFLKNKKSPGNYSSDQNIYSGLLPSYSSIHFLRNLFSISSNIELYAFLLRVSKKTYSHTFPMNFFRNYFRNTSTVSFSRDLNRSLSSLTCPKNIDV